MTKANGLDPITVEVVRHKLEGIANEMQLTLVRSAFSAIARKVLMAVIVPSSFDCGRSSTITATKRGSFAGANPANDEMYASST